MPKQIIANNFDALIMDMKQVNTEKYEIAPSNRRRVCYSTNEQLKLAANLVG